MSLLPSISMSHSAPLLTGEWLRAGLEACGYRCTTVLLSGIRSLPRGCTVSLQFGDCIAAEADGATCLTVRCSIQINGSGERVSGMTRWQIRRRVHAPAGPEQLHFVIEADLVLERDVSLADVVTHGADVYRHLHTLIGDACATLHDLSIDSGQREKAAVPVMRIEARFLGDLATGRSGLATSGGAEWTELPVSAAVRHLQMTRAACDWLKDDILPDLASAIRRVVLQVQTANRYPRSTNVADEQESHVEARSGPWPHDPSTQGTDDVKPCSPPRLSMGAFDSHDPDRQRIRQRR